MEKSNKRGSMRKVECYRGHYTDNNEGTKVECYRGHYTDNNEGTRTAQIHLQNRQQPEDKKRDDRNDGRNGKKRKTAQGVDMDIEDWCQADKYSTTHIAQGRGAWKIW